jgi:hypothetical protein
LIFVVLCLPSRHSLLKHWIGYMFHMQGGDGVPGRVPCSFSDGVDGGGAGACVRPIDIFFFYIS